MKRSKWYAILLIGFAPIGLLYGSSSENINFTVQSSSVQNGLPRIDIRMIINTPYGNTSGFSGPLTQYQVRATAHHTASVINPFLQSNFLNGFSGNASPQNIVFDSQNGGIVPNELYYNLQGRTKYGSTDNFDNNTWRPSIPTGTKSPEFVTSPADLSNGGLGTVTNRTFTVNWTDTHNPAWTKYEIHYCLGPIPSSNCFDVRAQNAGGVDVLKNTAFGVQTNLSAVIRNLPRGTLVSDIRIRALSFVISENIAVGPTVPKPNGNDLILSVPPGFGTTDVGPRIDSIVHSLNATNSQATLTATLSGSPVTSRIWSVVSTPAGGSASFSSTTANPTTVTFTKSGTYVFRLQVQDAQGELDEKEDTVNAVGAPGSITLSPGNQDVAFNDTVNLTATVKDVFGEVLSNQTITWSLSPSNGATLNPTGATNQTTAVFTAQTTQQAYTIQASVAGVSPATTILNVLGYKPQVTCTYTSIDNRSGTLSMPSVTDQDNPAGPFTYRWTYVSSGQGAAPTLSNSTSQSSGVSFTRSGAYVMQARVTDPVGLTGTCDASFTINPITSRVSVSPEEQFILTSRTESFTAQAYDQFDQPMAGNFSWTTTGGGTLSPRVGASQIADFTGINFGTRFEVRATETTTNLFGLAYASVGAFDVSNSFAYPVPFKAGTDTDIKFACFGLQATIRIYTASGRLVWESKDVSGGTGPGACQGEATWLVKNSNNEKLASGVYLYSIKSRQNEKKGKLIIIQ